MACEKLISKHTECAGFNEFIKHESSKIMKVLVIGGAGYVGSHTVRRLVRDGHDVVVYDNLSKGHAASVKECELIQGELADRDKLCHIFNEHRIEAVMHFAAFALVGESVAQPAMYYQNNVTATLELLEAMRKSDVWRIVFSSTTATYGQPDKIPIAETTPQLPINPYGFTKLVIEHALTDYAAAYGFARHSARLRSSAGPLLIGEPSRRKRRSRLSRASSRSRCSQPER